MALQIRRGLEVNRTSITPAAGEIIYTTDTNQIYVGDGTTPGGTPLNLNLSGDLTIANIIINSPGTINLGGNVLTSALVGTLANLTTASGDIINLFANAASQASTLDTLTANAATQTIELGTLTANAAAQANALDTLTANAAGQTLELSTLTANAASQAIGLTNLTANAASQANDLTVLTALAAGQVAEINSINANVAAANVEISTKASLTGAFFTGNVLANAFHSNTSARADTYFIGGSEIDQGLGETWANPAALFFGNSSGAANKYYQLNLQNVDPQGSGDIVVTADDGNDGTNHIALGIGGSAYSDPYYPSGVAHDGYVWITGGNLLLQSETNNVSIMAGNLANPQITFTTGNVLELNSNVVIKFSDGTIQSTAFGGNIDLSAIDANIGTIVTDLLTLDANVGAQLYTMGNYQNWTSNVTTISSALDQLAERLKNLGG